MHLIIDSATLSSNTLYINRFRALDVYGYDCTSEH